MKAGQALGHQGRSEVDVLAAHSERELEARLERVGREAADEPHRDDGSTDRERHVDEGAAHLLDRRAAAQGARPFHVDHDGPARSHHLGGQLADDADEARLVLAVEEGHHARVRHARVGERVRDQPAEPGLPVLDLGERDGRDLVQSRRDDREEERLDAGLVVREIEDAPAAQGRVRGRILDDDAADEAADEAVVEILDGPRPPVEPARPELPERREVESPTAVARDAHLTASALDVEVEARERELREDPPRVERVRGGRVLGPGDLGRSRESRRRPRRSRAASRSPRPRRPSGP